MSEVITHSPLDILDKDLQNTFANVCAQQGRTVSEVLTECIQSYCASHQLEDNPLMTEEEFYKKIDRARQGPFYPLTEEKRKEFFDV